MHHREQIAPAVRCCSGIRQGRGGRRAAHPQLTVPVSGGAKLLAEVIRDLDAVGIEIDDIGLRRPTLDDVFISLTGPRGARDEAEADE